MVRPNSSGLVRLKADTLNDEQVALFIGQHVPYRGAAHVQQHVVVVPPRPGNMLRLPKSDFQCLLGLHLCRNLHRRHRTDRRRNIAVAATIFKKMGIVIHLDLGHRRPPTLVMGCDWGDLDPSPRSASSHERR